VKIRFLFVQSRLNYEQHTENNYKTIEPMIDKDGEVDKKTSEGIEDIS